MISKIGVGVILRNVPRLVAVACVLASACHATPLMAQIELRASYRVHEPIEIHVTGTTDVTLWRLPSGVATISHDNGRKLYAWAAPGRYTLSVTCLTVDWDAKSIDAKEHSATLVIEGTGPVIPDPTIPGPTPDEPPSQVTQVTYVYEKSRHYLPNQVAAELDRLNRAGILATSFEADTVDSTGQTPRQYVAALAAAKAAGLPCLVSQRGSTVFRVKVKPLVTADVQEVMR